MIAEWPDGLQQSQRLCQLVKVCMHYLLMLGHSPKDAAQTAAAEFHGMDGLVLI